MKVAITGHRPERIKGKEKEIQNWIIQQLKELQKQEEVILLNGMARGVDQIAAVAAIQNGIQVNCYFSYRHKLHSVEQYVVDHAKEVRYECEEWEKDCYLKRDRHMVNDCDVLLVVWDGIKIGGAYYTYRYAKKNKKRTISFPWKEINNGLE